MLLNSTPSISILFSSSSLQSSLPFLYLCSISMSLGLAGLYSPSQDKAWAFRDLDVRHFQNTYLLTYSNVNLDN